MNRSPTWSQTGSLAKVAYANSESSGADDADIDDEDEFMATNERTKVLVHRKPKDNKADDVGDVAATSQQTPLCGTASSASDDQPLIDREQKPAT